MKRIVSFIACIVIAFALHAEAYIGYLMTINSISDFPEEKQNGIAQQPERNAAIWFEDNYVESGKGRFITLSEAANDDLSGFKAIWVNADRVGYSNLSALGINENVIEGLKKYVKMVATCSSPSKRIILSTRWVVWATLLLGLAAAI